MTSGQQDSKTDIDENSHTGQGNHIPGQYGNIDPEHYKVLLEYSQYYLDAEHAAKVVEQLDAKAIIPCINQLRYAGAHLSRFFVNNSGNHDEELDSYKRHCKRAKFDAYEAGLIICLESFMAFQNDYKNIVITDVWVDYYDACDSADKASEFLRDVNKEKIRDDQYKQCSETFESLKEIHKKIKVVRNELNKKIKKDRRIFVITIIGIVLTALGAVFTFLSWRNGQPPPTTPHP